MPCAKVLGKVKRKKNQEAILISFLVHHFHQENMRFQEKHV